MQISYHGVLGELEQAWEKFTSARNVTESTQALPEIRLTLEAVGHEWDGAFLRINEMGINEIAYAKVDSVPDASVSVDEQVDEMHKLLCDAGFTPAMELGYCTACGGDGGKHKLMCGKAKS